jgi:hypothetical protein
MVLPIYVAVGLSELAHVTAAPLAGRPAPQGDPVHAGPRRFLT